MPAPRPVEIRFWEHVRKTDGCWEWQRNFGSHGYGQISYNLKPVLAHRLSWELHNGSIPKGLCVLHKCDNKKCVKPSHLFLGTKLDNALDMISKGRSWAQRNPEKIRAVWRKYLKGRNANFGENNGKSKLVGSDVIQIKRMIRNGITPRDIGEKFGVDRSTISIIARGKTWRRVGGQVGR